MLKIWKFYSWYCEKFTYASNDYFVEKCKVHYFFVNKCTENKNIYLFFIDEDGRSKETLKKVKKEKVHKHDNAKKIKVKKHKKEVRVKNEPENLNSDKSLSVKVENGRTEISEKPASPIKSYLSGGNTPPRKISPGDSPSNKFPQATSTPDVKQSEKESQESFSVGLKRKHVGSGCDSNSHCKVSKVRRNSGQASRDSGLGSSTSSVSSIEMDRNRSSATRRKESANSMDCSQPLDDLWNGSLLPLLPESTKTQERGMLIVTLQSYPQRCNRTICQYRCIRIEIRVKECLFIFS